MVGKSDELPNRLALDVKASDDLRMRLKNDTPAGIKQAAQEFEALFLREVLKSMRDAVPNDGLFDSDQTRFYTDMLDQQLAQDLSRKGTLGFAEMIEKQLAGKFPPDAAALERGNAASALGLPATTSQATSTTAEALQNYRYPVAPASVQNGLRIDGQAPGNAAAGSAAIPADAGEFVSQVWPYAVEASQQLGIPAQYLVAHAALESGWGKSSLRRADGSPAYNLFGIKVGKNWTGDTVDMQTVEYVNGQAQTVTARFRAYSSYADSFRDYAALLRNNARYAPIMGTQSGSDFAKGLQRAGYATDPEYADKLSRIINGPTLRQALFG
jgi:peptidoglycan hydrolase FlgJ